MNGTISNTVTATYTLTVNPTTIDTSGLVSVAFGFAIFGPGDATIINHGTVQASSNVGIEIRGGASIVNSGLITTSALYSQALFLVQGGSVVNAAGGTISNPHGVAVYAYKSYAAITNAGVMGAIALGSGGTVINEKSGTSNQGIRISGGGAVANAGVIRGEIVLYNGGGVSNASSGTIDAGVVVHGEAGIVTNAGSISDVQFDANLGSRLIAEPGARLGGAYGGNTIGASIASVLELAPGSGTLSGLGVTIDNFGSIAFDSGAAWELSGTSSALAGGETISGFANGDTLDLTGVTNAAISDFNAGTLTLSTSGGLLHLLLPDSTYTTQQFHAAPSPDGTAITVVACFAAGARILTSTGETEVQHLRVGDRVLSPGGRLLPVLWLGHRHLDCNSHPHPPAVWPVRVRRGAFAPNVPHRDLMLSPDHAVRVGEVLIPIRCLVNGTTIAKHPMSHIEYWHLELPAHDLVLAEGLTAESYLDTGNRSAFNATAAPARSSSAASSASSRR
jgi:hypothetical protein